MTGSGLLGLAALCAALGGTLLARRLRRGGMQPTNLPEPCDLPGLSGPGPGATSTAHAAHEPEASPLAPPPEELPPGTALAVLAIEVNGLSNVDQRFGEVTGQRALREVSALAQVPQVGAFLRVEG